MANFQGYTNNQQNQQNASGNNLVDHLRQPGQNIRQAELDKQTDQQNQFIANLEMAGLMSQLSQMQPLDALGMLLGMGGLQLGAKLGNKWFGSKDKEATGTNAMDTQAIKGSNPNIDAAAVQWTQYPNPIKDANANLVKGGLDNQSQGFLLGLGKYSSLNGGM